MRERVRVCVHIYVCMNEFMREGVPLFACIFFVCTYICMRERVRVCVHIYVCMNECMREEVRLFACVYVCIHAHTCWRTRTFVLHVCMCACMPVYMYMCIHAHMI